MSRSLFVAALLPALAAAAPAQEDRIVWADGTVATRVRVRSFTWRAVEYEGEAGSQERSADAVASLAVERVKDVFARAYTAAQPEDGYQRFLEIAEEQATRDPFVAQFGYVEAARVQIARGDCDAARAVLAKMVERLPDTGFYPHRFRIELDHCLAQGASMAAAAKEIAGAYDEAAQQGWPIGFVHEAASYAIMARAAAGELADAELADALQALLARTQGACPAVAHRIALQVADRQRADGEVDAARAAYLALADPIGVDDVTRGRALLGLGYTYLERRGRPEAEASYDAMIAFLRAYLESAAVARELRAEALYRAARACETWRGPDADGAVRRLRDTLERDFAESTWAKR